MKWQRKYKKITAFFWMAVYLFIALFAQNFHHHSTGYSYNTPSKESKIFVDKYSKFSHEKDCLSCHFLADGHYLIPDLFQQYISSPVIFQDILVVNHQDFKIFFFSSLYLRGPPSFIV